jgi:hypothetical protein
MRPVFDAAAVRKNDVDDDEQTNKELRRKKKQTKF